jgi:hypothetical protein
VRCCTSQALLACVLRMTECLAVFINRPKDIHGIKITTRGVQSAEYSIALGTSTVLVGTVHVDS